jgi:hypothetical protein
MLVRKSASTPPNAATDACQTATTVLVNVDKGKEELYDDEDGRTVYVCSSTVFDRRNKIKKEIGFNESSRKNAEALLTTVTVL